jgi:class 3 adenylate cyclase/tetratricopeptide (TPR) repeat protein
MRERSPDPAARLSPYVPRPVAAWLSADPSAPHHEVEGTLVFADISGFTALSERLARQGRLGAEILAETISSCFGRLLATAYSNGGSLLKFGGDALLLLFTGADHERRACHAAVGMRRELRGMGPIDGPGGRMRLRMSVGAHCGRINLFMVGDRYRELVVTGPVASRVVEMEAAAQKGEIIVSPELAGALPGGCVGARSGPGHLVRRGPSGMLGTGADPAGPGGLAAVSRGVPPWLAQLVLDNAADAQHRHATVAFLKFQGTEALLREEGADALAEELGRLVADVEAAAARHEVFLLGSDVDRDGGKLIVIGGAPVATGHADESVLCLSREVLAPSRRLQVRFGVNAGAVFVGDIGPTYRRTFTVMGDAVNLAARVMAHAAPGTVLATPAVVDRCRASFAVTPVVPFLVKGKTAPVAALEVGDPTATGDDDLAGQPLIGRDAEIAELETLWQSARGGQGRAAVIVGEPGLGKSRLTAELRSRADGKCLVVACEQYAAHTPYAAARQLVRQALGCTDDDRVKERLDAVLHGAAAGLTAFAPLLGRVLGVEVPMTAAVADLDERFQRERLEETTVDLLEILLGEPTVLLVEDLHWMDEASADLMGTLLRRLPRMPWLLCSTRRPVDRGWVPAPAPHVSITSLQPLHPNAASALAETLAVDLTALEPERLAQLVERAGGNPLFLTELLAGAHGAAGAELPDSLEGLILARIDALPPTERSLIRHLSVLGATFDLDLARSVLGQRLPERHSRVWAALREFVQIDSAGRLSFKHALLMDGAYNSLTFRVRESLHATVGETIERTAGVAIAEHAEALSLHFLQAKRFAKAWRYSRLAAERARSVYANAEAALFYERAIEAARRGGGEEHDEMLVLFEELGDTRRRMGEPAAAEAAYRQARRIAPQDPVVLARLLLKQASVRQQEGAHTQALRWLHRAEALIGTLDVPAAVEQRARIAIARASVAKDRNRPADIVRWCERAVHEAERIGDKAIQAHASFLLDHGYVRLGRRDLATNSATALALYEQVGDLWGQGTVHNNLGGHAYWAGRWEDAVAHYTCALDAFTRIGDVSSRAAVLVNIGEIRSDQGRVDEADELFRQSLQIWQRAGDRASVAYVQSDIGRLATRREQFDVAVEHLTAARDLAQQLGLPADVLDADLRLLECRCHAGEAAETLAGMGELIARVDDGSIPAAMLYRLGGYASLQLGRLPEARRMLEDSLGHARRADAPYEVGLTLRALAYADAAEGRDPMWRLTEAEAVFTPLNVVAVDEPITMSPSAFSRSAIPLQQVPDVAESMPS